MRFIKKYWLFALLLLMLTLIIFPLIISYLITAGEWLSWFEGTSNVWIGFWGSYLGGVVGTAGVIYVAQLQNNTQKESLETIENHNRERLSIQTKLDMIQNFKNELNTFKNEVDEYKGSFATLVEEAINYDMSIDLGYSAEDSELIFSKHQNKFVSLGPKYFSDLFSTIETNSILLSQLKDVELEAFSIEDRKNFEKLDEIVRYVKIENIDAINKKSNIFNLDLNSIEFLSPFQLASGGLDYMNKELSSAQSKLVNKIDSTI